MKFTIGIIARNEALNIPKLAESAKDFISSGGEVCLLDTGSTDDTYEVALKLGFKAYKSESKFLQTLTKSGLTKWKKKYHIQADPVTPPIEFFCFDDARNAAAKYSSNDIIFFMDGSDYFINFDYNAVNKLIEEGYDQFNVVQMYGGQTGRINRFYNRTKGVWRGRVHEFVESHTNMRGYDLPEETLYIFHKYVEKDRSARYMAGLIVTHSSNPVGRWDYYLGRELYFAKLYTDAKVLFKRCYDLGWWAEERAKAMCLTAKCVEAEGGKPAEIQVYYKKAYDLKSSLREACFEVAQYCLDTGDWVGLKEAAMRCMELITTQPSAFFEEARFNNVENLYAYLYLANWWVGTKDMSYYYWKKFVKAKYVDETRHPHWVFFSKYRRLPDTPYMIVDMSQSGIDNSMYKCISTIDAAKPTFPMDDQMFMKFSRRYISPCMDAYMVTSKNSTFNMNENAGFRVIDISKIIFPRMVHAFEPLRKKYQRLNANAFLNSRENIKTYNMSIGKVERMISVKHSDDALEESQRETTLDIIADESTSKSDIGCIAIEESQHEMVSSLLQGCMKIITKTLPFIVVSGCASRTGPLSDIESKICDMGYTRSILNNSNYYIPQWLQTKRVAIVCASYTELKWDSEWIEEAGEAEIAVINLANELAGMGWLVDVWGSPKNDVGQKFRREKPRYFQYKYFREVFESSDFYNAVVWWRFSSEVFMKKERCKNILWLYETGSVSGDCISKVDTIVFLSESHKQIMMGDTPDTGILSKSIVIPNGFCTSEYNHNRSISTTSKKYSKDDEVKSVVIQNGFCTSEYNRSFSTISSEKSIDSDEEKNTIIHNGFCTSTSNTRTRIALRCVYLNNYAYGLDGLLTVWPFIRKAFPTSTLVILHSPRTWGLKTFQEEWQLEERITSMRDQGVEFIGKVSEIRLDEELCASEYWLYPCTTQESYCVQGVHALSRGVIPVVFDQPFLKELCPQECVISKNSDSTKFAEKCIEVMRMPREFFKEKIDTCLEKYPKNVHHFASKFLEIIS